MSLYEYKSARELLNKDPPFYGLIMAAMIKGDVILKEKLRSKFPQVWNELIERSHKPGGLLEGEADFKIGSVKQSNESS
jgi:hypothetical protein